VREIFGRLQFRTLLDRLLKTAAEEGHLDSSGAPGGELETGAVGFPVVRTLIDEELGNWLAKASADGQAIGVQVELGPGGITGFGLAADNDTVFVPWAADRPDYQALEEWLASPAPKHFFYAKPQFKALSRAGLIVDGLAFDTRLAGWLVRPGSGPQTLADQVYEVLGETLPQSDPTSSSPSRMR